MSSLSSNTFSVAAACLGFLRCVNLFASDELNASRSALYILCAPHMPPPDCGHKVDKGEQLVHYFEQWMISSATSQPSPPWRVPSIFGAGPWSSRLPDRDSGSACAAGRTTG